MRWARTSAMVGLVAVLAGCASGQPGGAAKGAGPYDAVAAVQPAAVAPSAGDSQLHAIAEQKVAAMTLEQKLASLIMVNIAGTDPTVIRTTAQAEGVGGLILMGNNIGASVSDVRALIQQAQPDPAVPLLTAVDEEGGTVHRLPGDVWPAGIQLANASPETVTAAFSQRASLVEEAGISLNFGVIADETDNPASFIYDRVLGTNTADAARNVTAAVEGERGKVWTTLKHFPGHGAVTGDSHTSVPVTSQSMNTWLTKGAVPFESGIAAGAQFVMMAHVVYSAVDSLPASLSPAWYRILRQTLGFTGIITTDSMSMLQASGDPRFADPGENAVLALAAGTDMLLYAGNPDVTGIVTALAAAVRGGRIPEAQVTESAVRLMEYRLKGSAAAPVGPRCADSCRDALS